MSRKKTSVLPVMLIAALLLSACSTDREARVDIPLRLEDALAQGSATEYRRMVLDDPRLGCEAVRSVVPTGWTAGGQVLWNMQSAAYPATIDFFVQTKNMNARSGYVSNVLYVQPDQNALWAQGNDWQEGTLAPARYWMSSEDYIKSFFPNYVGIPYAEILDVRYPSGEWAQVLDGYKAMQDVGVKEVADQMNAYMATQGARITWNTYLDAAQVTFRFKQNGTVLKGKATCAIYTNQSVFSTSNQYFSASETTITWEVPQFTYYIADESMYDAYEGGAEMFLSNVIVNSQWRQAITNAAQKTFNDQADRKAKWLQQQTNALIAQSQALTAASTYSYSNPSGGGSGGSGGYSSSVMNGATNAIVGNSYYEAPDGGAVLLDYNQYHYTDGTNIYSSDSPLNTGGTNLYELTDLGTMGGG